MLTPNRSGAVKASLSSAPSLSGTIRFDGERVVQGLVFHILDDKHADRVSDASVRSNLERMRNSDLHLAIARELWEAMSNRERFEWLLARSGTHVVYSGRCAVFIAER